MKRLFSNKRGEASFGQKWQNTESSIDDNGGGGDLHTREVVTAQEDYGDPIPKGKIVEVTVKEGEQMYLAAMRGDWTAAEVLLGLDPNLAFDYVTVEGDRALHVAAAMKHKVFVGKLVGRMSEEELLLLDGHGNTACCYAALSGNLEIARLIIGDRPYLVTARDEKNATPLHKAALLGSKKMLSCLLGYTKGEDLSREEWFDLLLITIRREMLNLANDILGKNGSIATMANEEGTALHTLARVETIYYRPSMSDEMRKSMEEERLLELLKKPVHIVHEAAKAWNKSCGFAKKLWDEMLKMEKASLAELMKKPVHIVHEAAKTGNLEILDMLTRDFPKLMWETDNNGYTIFHLAIMHRKRRVFDLVHAVKPMLGSRTTWRDKNGNNMLHLAAAKSASVTGLELSPAYRLKCELEWFKDVKNIALPSCLTMRNREGLTPKELLFRTHSELLKESKVNMTNRADSLMLIATILLTVVFAAAFTVPGGYSSQTGEPLLAKMKWFKAFIVFEIISFVLSVISIMIFQSIMASSFKMVDFLFYLPTLQKAGFATLLMSLVAAFLAFMSSISLFNIGNMTGLVWSAIYIVCWLGSFHWLIGEFGLVIPALQNTYKL